MFALPQQSPLSTVLETPAALLDVARRHFAAKLTVETDPDDVATDLANGVSGFVIVDVRSAEHYAERHIAGAVSLPRRILSPATTAALSKDDVIVVYCWGPACNGATKAAIRFAELGFRVKEMIGGIEYWAREGRPTEGTRAHEPFRPE